MYPKIVSLYGPFELNSYNAAIMMGIALFLYLANSHPTRKLLMSSTDFINLCTESALAALIGGRLLHVLSSLHQYPDLYSMLSIWDGGLSILGSLIAVVSYALWAVPRRGLSFLAIGDLVALYLPLVHAAGRVGCFLVGCCHGAPTDLSWAVIYTDPRVVAPLHCPLHPSQLYSAALFLLLFVGLWLYERASTVKASQLLVGRTGTMTCLYIMGLSCERFIIDFFRGDRVMLSGSPLSWYQWISLALFIGASGALIHIRHRSAGAHESL
jgi:phosphatidylglycerol---prolipoprotein diacylglyceryl transferase